MWILQSQSKLDFVYCSHVITIVPVDVKRVNWSILMKKQNNTLKMKHTKPGAVLQVHFQVD